MSRESKRFAYCLFVFPLIALLCASCAGPGAELAANPPQVAAPPVQAVTPLQVPFPEDALQPWEQSGRGVSGVTADSEFVPGVERFSADGQVSENGEALRLESGTPGGGNLAYAIYRIELEGVNPGVVSIDANLLDEVTLSEGYYIALADYTANHWAWHGPFTDSHVRICTGRDVRLGKQYTSSLGNAFVCMAVWNGAGVDVVGVGLERYAAADVEPPPAPDGLTATPLAGGVELRWLASEADDLAGYLVCWRAEPFSFPDGTGVKQLGYLEGETRHIVKGLDGDVHFRVFAVDFSGNWSAMSNMVLAGPIPQQAPQVLLLADTPSGLLHSEITLTASGAEHYDWDLDGDGVFDDVTGDPVGIQQADTSSPGIIRPAVRGSSGGDESQACGAVSLLIHSNARPVASAVAMPATGIAPHTVTFVGEGEDPDGVLVAGGWDFDGNGIYEYWIEGDMEAVFNPSTQNYPEPGIYNVKLRVVDDGGAWDVDTVAVLVTPPGLPENELPSASLVVYPSSGSAPLEVELDASGSFDPDGSIVRYDYDVDADGLWEIYDGYDHQSWTYTEDGDYLPIVRVTDDRWGQMMAQTSVSVATPPNQLPTASFTVDFPVGSAPHTVVFNASASSDPDGTIVRYDWDLDGDSVFDRTTTVPSFQHTYATPGYYWVWLQVTDDRGGIDSTAIAVTVHGWRPQVVADGGLYGYGCWLVESNDEPTIGYWHATSSESTLYVIHSDDAHGSGWGPPVQVAQLAIPGSTLVYSDMALIDGTPAVCYGDEESAEKLYFRRANDAAGTSWAGAVQVMQATGNLGDMALVEVLGHPAICVFDNSSLPPNVSLLYFRASDASGSAWGGPVTVRGGSVGGYDIEMTLINGVPAAVYTNASSYWIEYNYALSTDGSSWAPGYVDLGATGFVGGLIEVADVSTITAPLVSFRATGNADLKVSKGMTASGSVWYSADTVDDTYGSGQGSSMVFDDMLQQVYLFHLDGADRLAYSRSIDTFFGTTSWYTSEVVDAYATGRFDTAPLRLSGSYAVAYYDDADDLVKFAYLY